MKESNIHEQAQARVKAKKDFHMHFAMFCAVNLFLFMLNWLTSPEFWWFLIPAGGWAIGLVGHYFQVYGFFGSKSQEWEQKALSKEIKRIKQERGESIEEEEEEDFLELEDELELKEKVKLPKDYNEEDLV